jgi:prepilin-type N-terminal cleavage/methylation domain-containing protein
METKKRFDSRGMTLIELLVVLVISTILIGGIYRLFASQSKVYTIQDQVVEVQQNTRAAMEILLRDLRMTGFDNDRTATVIVPDPPLVPEDHAFTVMYEQNDALRQVRYWVDGGARLLRQETINGVSNTEALLENVNALNFSYGTDENGDGVMDDRDGDQMLSLNDWVPQAAVGTRRVVAVRASLTARPNQVNQDLQNTAPRTLVSAITLRNLSMTR